jgi:hypothetical protein
MATDQICSDGKLIIDARLRHGMDYVELPMGQDLESKEHTRAAWIQEVSLLARWKHNRHFVKLYELERVADDTILSRIIGLAADPGYHKWTKRERITAAPMHDDNPITDKDIAERIGCTENDVRMLF